MFLFFRGISSLDFKFEFEIVGLLARFFRGGLTIPDMMKMTFKDVFFWYENYELQVTEEEVVSELSYDDKGNKRTLPSPSVIREIVDERIKERREKWQGKVDFQ